jgi:exosortase
VNTSTPFLRSAGPPAGQSCYLLSIATCGMTPGNNANAAILEDSSPAIQAARTTRARLRPRTIAALAVLGTLLIVCYYPMLLMTGTTIIFSDDMAYGFFAPIVAIYVAWNKRSALLNSQAPSSPWCLALGGLGACVGIVAALANSSTFSRLGFLLSLAACLLWAGGGRALRRFAFPLGLLLFTFPMPEVLYGEITQPLQLLATRLAESTFEILGFSVLREGNILQLTYMSLSVVEACSGLRSLITLVFFCLVYAYFFESRLWLRLGVVLGAIPSAILVNALRITATGVLGKYNQAWTEGTVHEVVGWTAFTLGFVLVLVGHLAVRRVLRYGFRAEAGTPA